MEMITTTYIRKTTYSHFLPALLFFVLLFISCEKNDSVSIDAVFDTEFNGTVKKIESLGYYSKTDVVQQLQILANLKDIKQEPVETICGYYLYRITYQTTNFDGRKIWVSGLLGMPDIKDVKGIVSWQHGTNPDRNNSPSKPSVTEGIGPASVFSGDGYILLAPDYIGLGESYEVPTYFHTESTVSTIVDFLLVGEKILTHIGSKQNNLFLVGFSQGGHATAAVHRSIEKYNHTSLNLKVSACIGGVYNLKDIALPYVVKINSSYYMAHIANSYSLIYGHPLESLVKPEWTTTIRSLFDGSKSNDYIYGKLPAYLSSFMQNDVLDDFRNGKENWFTLALEENEVYDWKPINEIRLYYGSEDKDASPENPEFTYNHMKAFGGNVELICVGAVDHGTSNYHAFPIIQKWFNEK